MEIKVTLPTDMDGFLDYKCPFCDRHFRLNRNLFHNDDYESMFCPYCGLKSSVKSFMPEEIEEYIQESALSIVQKELDKNLSKLSVKSKYMKVSYTPSNKIVAKPIILDEYMASIYYCNACDVSIKTNDGEQIKHFCACCGEMKI